MSFFHEVGKLSVTTAVLAVLTIFLGYLGVLIEDPVRSFEFSMLGIFSLILFFFSLKRDKSRSGGNAPVE